MRILCTFENAIPNTAADSEQFLNTAAALARRGHHVTLATPAPATGPATRAELEAFYGLELPLELKTFGSLPLGFYARHIGQVLSGVRFEPQDYDLVYTRNLAMAAVLLARGHTIFFDHYRLWGDQIPPLQPLIRWILCHPRCLGASLHSELARRSYLRLGVPAEKLTVAHNGWDPTKFSPRLEMAEARRQLALPSDELLVVYTGRINEKKGLEACIAMARRLRNRPVRFLLVGSAGDGPIERLARAEDNVTVLPWQPASEVSKYLTAADVLLLPPSDQPLAEGNTVLPLKLFLYLAAGRAIFGPRSPDTAELLSADNACLIDPVSMPNVEPAVRALEALLDDSTERERLGENAASLAQSLTWDRRAELLESFIEERRAAPPSERSTARSETNWLAESGDWLAGLVRGQPIRRVRSE